MSKYLLLCVLLLFSCGPNEVPTGPGNEASETPGSENIEEGSTSDVQAPSPEVLANFTGMEASECSEEGSLLSQDGPATSVIFKNSSDEPVTIYWLDMQGERVEYKKLAADESHTQRTFVTYPWLIANEKDQCLGIYTATSTSNVILDIKSF